MSVADLDRLVARATPRKEDWRACDRRDYITKEFGHMTLREVVDAIDALEFTADSFNIGMRERAQRDVATPAEGPASPMIVDPTDKTGVDGLFRVAEGLRVLQLPSPAPASIPEVEEVREGAAGWEEVVADARSQGAECFKKKDFEGALQHYSKAIEAAASGFPEIHTLYSNRSAARLQLGDAVAALDDASRCVLLAPAWPKGYFRKGNCLRQLESYELSIEAFNRGRALEPDNGDWAKELEKSNRLLSATPSGLVRQLLLNLSPEILRAWVRGGAKGVLQLQVNGELTALGTPKWQLQKDLKDAAKGMIRYAYMEQKEYLANLLANMQNPPGRSQDPPVEHVAVVDLEKRSLKIPEISAFMSSADTSKEAIVHVDVRYGSGKEMVALICRIPCDEEVRRYLGSFSDPPAPKGEMKGVLQIQRASGFPKTLPRYIGFHNYPGDLTFPVVDSERDAPSAVA